MEGAFALGHGLIDGVKRFMIPETHNGCISHDDLCASSMNSNEASQDSYILNTQRKGLCVK